MDRLACPARLLDRDQAITVLTVVKLLAGGYPDECPLVVALHLLDAHLAIVMKP